MKTVSDYIKLVEDAAMATNTISGGAIATKEVPLGGKGNIAKRKPLEETIGPGDGSPTKPLGTTGVDDPNPLGDTVGKDPLSTVYASCGKGPGGTCNDPNCTNETHRLNRLQQYQNDQIISYE